MTSGRRGSTSIFGKPRTPPVSRATTNTEHTATFNKLTQSTDMLLLSAEQLRTQNTQRHSINSHKAPTCHSCLQSNYTHRTQRHSIYSHKAPTCHSCLQSNYIHRTHSDIQYTHTKHQHATPVSRATTYTQHTATFNKLTQSTDMLLMSPEQLHTHRTHSDIQYTHTKHQHATPVCRATTYTEHTATFNTLTQSTNMPLLSAEQLHTQNTQRHSINSHKAPTCHSCLQSNYIDRTQRHSIHSHKAPTCHSCLQSNYIHRTHRATFNKLTQSTNMLLLSAEQLHTQNTQSHIQ